MIKALAPRMRRGYSRVCLSILMAGGFVTAVHAQAPKGTAPQPPVTKDSPKNAAPDDALIKGLKAKSDDASTTKQAEPAPSKKPSSFEIFKDDKAEEALEKFKSTGFKACKPADIAAVKSAAGGGDAVDRETLQRFVQGMAFQLADKSNINAVVSPPPSTSPSSRAIQTATDNLIDPLNTAKLAQNTSFLNAYNKELVETLPKLFDNHLVPRIQAMIVLGQTGSPAAVPVFLEQIKNPNQTMWVKLWALRGLNIVVENGTKVDTAINAQDGINAAKVVSDFLKKSEDLPWFVEMRALEVIGAMRQSTIPPQKAEFAVTAMKFLADPEARPEVRAAAAWALGMVRVSPATTGYNYGLIAHDIGLVAAEIGEEINSTFSANPTRASYLTSLLVTPIYQAFNGQDGARESGLLKATGAAPTLPALRQVSDLTASVAKASVDLIRSPNGQIPARKKDLGERVANLKTFLDKNPPKDYHLIPGGDEFRVAEQPVVEAPVEKAKVAGARSAR